MRAKADEVAGMEKQLADLHRQLQKKDVDPATSQGRVTELGELRKQEHQTKKMSEELVDLKDKLKKKM